MDTQEVDEANHDTTIGDDPTPSSVNKCWAVLAPCSTHTTVPPTEITEDTIVIGRNSSCGVRIDDRRVSSRHAKVYREPDSAAGVFKVFIVDLSTNGTFLNKKRISKNTPIKLQSGVEIALSPPDSSSKIAFLVQLLDLSLPSTQPSNPVSTTHQDAGTPSTSPPASNTTTNTSHVQPPTDPTPPPPQLTRTGTEIRDVPASKKDSTKEQIQRSESNTAKTDKKDETTKPDNASTTDKPDNAEKTDIPDKPDNAITTDKPDKKEENQPTADTVAKDSSISKTDKRPLTDDDESEPPANKKQRTDPTDASDQPKLDKEKEKNDTTADSEIEEHLICGICQSLFHKCISLIPCMHNFCAYCIGEWSQRSKQCPQCRQNVKGVSKNHIINNVVGGYLTNHPSRARPKAELDEMDAKCPITDAMLQKGKLYGLAGWGSGDRHSDDEGSSSDNSDDDEEDESSEEEVTPTCRQCRAPGPDGFQCPPGGAHLTCSSCHQLVPNRPADPTHPTPSVTCQLCSQVYCDLYWGCSSFFGKGIIKPISQFQFPAIPLHTMYNNAAEVKYTQDILTFNHIAGPTGLWGEILKDLDSGKLVFNGTPNHVNVTSNLVSCQNCARTTFESLLYKWRAALPADKIPPLVAMRPNCHWGKNCRTQQHKQDHAVKFNHVCEQTKF